MTLLIALRGIDPTNEESYIILGCDSRGVSEQEDAPTTRIQINKFRKAFPITKYSAVLIAGDAGKGLYLIDEFKKERISDSQDTTDLAKMFSSFCKNQFRMIDTYTLSTSSAFPNVGFIFAGMNRNRKKSFCEPKIYLLGSEGLFSLSLKENFHAEGMTLIANYFLEKYYKENLKINDACQLVAQAIYDTQRLNGNVGGPINLLRIVPSGLQFIDADDFYTEWDEARIEEIVRGQLSFTPK